MKRWRKDRILETYLNQVYFGAHAYGAEAAAQTYFSKHAANLNLDEAALIAGLPQAPSVYDPFQNPDQALARRNDVLRAMRDADDISESAYQAAVGQPLELDRGQIYTRIREPFFFSYVRELLIDEYGADGGAKRRAQGLHDDQPALQRIAIDSMKSVLNQPGDPASAIVSINPHERRDQGDDRGRPGQEGDPVQPGGAGATAVGLVVQDVRPHRGDPPGDQPVHDEVPLGAVPLAARPELASRGTSRRTATRTSAPCRSPPRRYARTTRSTRA